jgi:hypothetical protein
VASLGAVACVPKGGSTQELVNVVERATGRAHKARPVRVS